MVVPPGFCVVGPLGLCVVAPLGLGGEYAFGLYGVNSRFLVALSYAKATESRPLPGMTNEGGTARLAILCWPLTISPFLFAITDSPIPDPHADRSGRRIAPAAFVNVQNLEGFADSAGDVNAERGCRARQARCLRNSPNFVGQGARAVAGKMANKWGRKGESRWTGRWRGGH